MVTIPTELFRIVTNINSKIVVVNDEFREKNANNSVYKQNINRPPFLLDRYGQFSDHRCRVPEFPVACSKVSGFKLLSVRHSLMLGMNLLSILTKPVLAKRENIAN